MIEWMNREKHEQRGRNRRWRFLGLMMLGVALAVYWLDRKTSKAFEQTPNLDLRQTPTPSTPRDGQRATEPASEMRTSGSASPAIATHASAQASASGSGAGTFETPNEFSEEPNTPEEDERIVMGETGQLPQSNVSDDAGGAEETSLTAPAVSSAEPRGDLADTGPIPTATNGLIEGNGTHDCPDGYPVKGNASSRIYHLPGESTYDVTIPEVCFATEEDAATAGYRPRKH